MFGQEYNLRNEYGQKTGEWIERFDNGKIKEIRYYTPIDFEITNEIDTILFNNDTIYNFDFNRAKIKLAFQYGAIDYNGNISNLPSHLSWTEKYIYNDDETLKHILKIDSNRNQTHLYGIEKEISIDSLNFSIESRVGKISTLAVPIKNHSQDNIQFTIENSPNNILTNHSYLLANETSLIELKISPEPNKNKYIITISGKGFKINLTINVTGYDFKTVELKEDKIYPFKVGNIVFKRTNSEALLNILNTDSKVVKNIPLTHDLTQIDVSDLKSGKYIFEVVDFTNASKTKRNIILE